MLKVRITFIDDKKGNKELQESIKNIEEKYTILNKSRTYGVRGQSKYSNIYLEIENKE